LDYGPHTTEHMSEELNGCVFPPKGMTEPIVTITELGRCGYVHYFEGKNEVVFDWELGVTVIALIWAAPARAWDEKYPWAAGRQARIFEFVAQEVIRQKAPVSKFLVDTQKGQITIF
jgi:hypothetical protein